VDRRQFFHQFLALFSGTAVAQLFNLASYPLLARLYTPADFGLFGTFIAAAAIPGALACGRFELGITTAPDSGRRAILWLCYALAFAVACISTIVMAFYWSWAQAPQLGLLLPMLFLSVLLTGVVNATTMYLMRHESFRYASFGGVVRTATTVIVQLAFVLAIPGPMGLIVGFAIGLVAQSLMGLAIVLRRFPIGTPEVVGMADMYRRFKHQVAVDIPGTLVAALSLNLIPFILQAMHGIRAVGHYALGQRVAVLPLQLFNDSLSQVFFQRAARAQEQRGEFWAEFRFTLLASGAVGLVTMIGLWLFARPVIAIYLGPNWDVAADILVILAPMLAIRGVTMSLATTVFVLGKPAWLLWHNLASLAAMGVAAAATWYLRGDVIVFVEYLSIAQGFEYAGFGLILMHVVHSRFSQQRARKA
jgi:lipopolysaccharide exporter